MDEEIEVIKNMISNLSRELENISRMEALLTLLKLPNDEFENRRNEIINMTDRLISSMTELHNAMIRQ